MNALLQAIPELPLSKRLKAGSSSDHDSVDTLVMAARPFENLERYGCFLRLQHTFHGAIDALYEQPRLNALLPGLRELPRYQAVCADLCDLGLDVPAKPQSVEPADAWHAIGWLYCSEGSNLGAAFLFKQSQLIGLGASHGARHLAAHPEGRGLHWRAFVALLDGLELLPAQQEAAIEGARDAFDFYRQALKAHF
jgi:heme oxygenase